VSIKGAKKIEEEAGDSKTITTIATTISLKCCCISKRKKLENA
jgi:hypothetical protein